jgi:hypothetical protein
MSIGRCSSLLAVLFLAVGPTTLAQDESRGVREFTQSEEWRVPAGVTRITVELWGGGGGGGGGSSSVPSAGPGGGGGGGGSGAYVRTSVSVKEGETYAIRVGAGGVGGRGESREAGQSGGDGEDTAILRDGEALVVAKAGLGGSAPKRLDVTGGRGGDGGAAEPTSTMVVRRGNRGENGLSDGFSEADSTPGGRGGRAVRGTLDPAGSFGGAGGAGGHFGPGGDSGHPGGTGSVVITW